MVPHACQRNWKRLRVECETLLQQSGELLEELRVSQEKTGTPVSDKASLIRILVRLRVPSIPGCIPGRVSQCPLPLAYRVPDELSATLSTERAATAARLENEVELRTRECIERMRAHLLSSSPSSSYLCTCALACCVSRWRYRPAAIAPSVLTRLSTCPPPYAFWWYKYIKLGGALKVNC